MNSRLCQLCKTISFDILRSQHGFEHHQKARILRFEAAKENGCPLCTMIWRGLCLDRRKPLDEDPVRLLLNPPGSPVESCSVSSDKPSPMYGIKVLCGKSDEPNALKWSGDEPVRWHVWPNGDTNGPLNFSEFDLRLFGINNDPVGDLVRYREISLRSDSDETFKLIYRWIHICRSTHKNCPGTVESVLPSRIIDIGPSNGSQEPYLLVQMADAPGQSTKTGTSAIRRGTYIALSYCWGRTPTITTTRYNLEERRRKISMAEFPRTIQDAIIITRKLIVRYLWVDALCILQGTDEDAKLDWQKESPGMREVYGNAFLTIVAASAGTVHEGIFSTRKPPDPPHYRLTYSLEYTPGRDGHVFVGFEEKIRDPIKEPLYHRAWTLQERILSPRALIYTRDQVCWECGSSKWSESGDLTSPIGSTRLRSQPDSIDWSVIVRDYSSRNLTYSMDKLPALSGLANEICERTGDEYLAGLWKNSLYDHLLWCHQHMVVGNETIRAWPPSYRAPSWSWASLDGNVWFPSEPRDFDVYYLKLLDHKVVPSGIDKFGAILTAYICVQGPLKRIHRIDVMDYTVYGKTSEDVPQEIVVGGVWLDMLNKNTEVNRTDPFVLEVMLSDLWALRVKQDLALVLTPTNVLKKEYRRMGVLRMTDAEIREQRFRDCEAIITIV